MTAHPSTTDRMFSATYAELKRLASRRLRGERPEHTLQPTALVHEAYLRLSRHGGDWQDRGHFLGVATRVMRQILVDWARERRSLKRGGDPCRITLDESIQHALPQSIDVLAFDRALTRLAAFDARKSRLVELRVLGGMTVPELADALDISTATVSREWRAARAWIAKLLAQDGPEGDDDARTGELRGS